MKNKITNIEELTAEIARLKIQKNEQQAFLINQYDLLSAKISAPARIMNLVFSRVPGVGALKGIFSGIGAVSNAKSKSDWLTKTLQFGLPIFLNKTLLKNAGWLKKAVVLLASESAATNINKAKISTVIDSITNFIKPKKKKKKATTDKEYEIVQTPVPVNHPPMI